MTTTIADLRTPRLTRALLDTNPCPALVVNRSARVEAYNAAAQATFGTLPGGRLGRSLLDPAWGFVSEGGDTLPGDLHPALLALLQTAPIPPTIIGVDTGDGDTWWFRVATALLDEDAEGTRSVLTVFDEITDDVQSAAEVSGDAERFRVAFERSPVGLAVVDESGSFVATNRAFTVMLGLSGEVEHLDWLRISELGVSARLAQLTQPPIVTGTPPDVIEFALSCGETRFGLTQLSPITWPGTDTATIVEIVDVTALTDQRHRADELSEQLEILFVSSPVGMALIGPDGRFQQANPAFARLYKTGTDEIVGRVALEMVHPDDRPVVAGFAERAASGRPVAVDHRAFTVDGQTRWLRTHLVHLDASTRPLLLAQSIDHTAQRRADQASRLVDRVTGLLSRPGLVDHLDQELIATRNRAESLVLFCVDIQGFRAINDRYGVDAADRLLERVGRSFQAAMPIGSTVGRSHGDVFFGVSAADSRQQAQRIADSILRALSDITPAPDAEAIAFTLGSLLVGTTDIDPEELLSRVERTAQAARRLSEHKVIAHAGDLTVGSPEPNHLRGYYEEMEDALRNDRYLVVGEPIMSMHDHDLRERYELLVRLVLPGDVRVSMPRFERHARRIGLADRIDPWMLERSFQLLAREPDMEVEVNLGVPSVIQPEIVDLIAGGASLHGFEPERLLLAIDESIITEFPRESLQLAERLHQHGFGIVIDNCGTTPRSLQLLESLDVRRAKLSSDTLGTIQLRTDEMFVRSAVETIRQLGVEVAVPFATDREALARARQLGVDLVQGRAVGPPTIFD